MLKRRSLFCTPCSKIIRKEATRPVAIASVSGNVSDLAINIRFELPNKGLPLLPPLFFRKIGIIRENKRYKNKRKR